MTNVIEDDPTRVWYADLDIASSNFVSSRDSYDWTEDKLVHAYISKLFSMKKKVYAKDFYGYYDISNKEEIEAFFSKERKAVYKKDGSEWSAVTEDTILLGVLDIVTIRFESDNLRIGLHTSKKEDLDSAKEFMSGMVTKRAKNNLGKAHVLSQNHDGLATRELGVVGVPLNLNNYSASVRQGIQSIVDDLRSPLPMGKLTILEGNPGSGKTFLIRSLISEITNAFFVIIPPAMVAQLGDPSIVPVLLSLKSMDDDDLSDEELLEKSSQAEEKVSNPIVLIVEDADECLISRNAGNMAAISSVLNLTSGILGDLLDIRIIATTNAKKTDLDPALLREGRMSYHLEVGALSYQEANEVYRRLIGDPDAMLQQPEGCKFNDDPVMLAHAYKEAKRKGYRGETTDVKANSNIPTKTSRRMGFV